MQQSKLIEVFFSLTSTERTALRKFVHSPYFNKREDVILLLDYLEKTDNEKTEHLSKEKTFSAIFPDENYGKESDGLLRYAMSFLLKLIEEFLIVREASQNELQSKIHLSSAYRRRHLGKHFKQSLEQAKIHLEKVPYRDFNYYESLFRIEQEKYLFTGDTQRNAPRNLQELSDTLDIQYIAAKLKQSCLLLAHQTVYKIGYETGLLDKLLEYVEQTPKLLEHRAIALYFYYYRAVTTDGEDYFNRYKDMLLDSDSLFPALEMRDLHIFALNYCTKKVNLQQQGFDNYFKIMLELYKAGLKQGFWLEDGQLNPFIFKNIVSVALWLKEFNWTAKFIRDFQPYLAVQHRTAYVNFALSKLCFDQKQYDEARILLQKVEYSDIFLNLNTKVMLMKIYYELDEYDVLESFLASFRTFVNRKKQSGELQTYHHENYLNIIRLAQKLLAFNPFDKAEKKKLKEEISGTKLLTEREWLLEQIR